MMPFWIIAIVVVLSLCVGLYMWKRSDNDMMKIVVSLFLLILSLASMLWVTVAVVSRPYYVDVSYHTVETDGVNRYVNIDGQAVPVPLNVPSERVARIKYSRISWGIIFPNKGDRFEPVP